jgi:uncharacterized protein YdeI (YjbR/CyaY-like superfamily)
MTAPAATFRTPAEWRAWLRRHHRTATELVVRCAKVHASHRGIGYAQALDEALCYGWIDGIRRSLDADGFSVRFTPRRPRSIWSRVNIAHVERLIRAGRMTKAGLAAFAAREEGRSGIYSFERGPTTLSPKYAKAFRSNPAAWAYYQGRPPGYRRTCTHWLMSAKREETRAKRLATLIACSAAHTLIPPLRRADR